MNKNTYQELNISGQAGPTHEITAQGE